MYNTFLIADKNYGLFLFLRVTNLLYCLDVGLLYKKNLYKHLSNITKTDLNYTVWYNILSLLCLSYVDICKCIVFITQEEYSKSQIIYPMLSWKKYREIFGC